MTLVLNLEPDLENAIQAEARKSGMNEAALVLSTLRDRFSRTNATSPALPPSLSREESELLQRINTVVSDALWDEYDDLAAKRVAETLSPEEHKRLIELSDRIERIHVDRIAAAAELGKIRNVPLKQIMDELGIRPRQDPNANP